MKVACVLITHLAAKAEVRRRPELRDRPFIVAADSGKGPVVLDASPQATGVVVATPLQEALSRCSGATLVDADQPHYVKTFEKVIESLQQRSPLVEVGEMGCAYVGIHGLEGMYGGEAKVVAALLNAVPEAFSPRVGLASDKFPAYVAAATVQGGRAVKVPMDVAGFLREISVDLLPFPWEDLERLHEFGIHTMGQVASLSIGPMQAQLGQKGKKAWELSNGIDSSPLVPVRHQLEIVETLSFAVPATNLNTVSSALETLLGKAFNRPDVRGKYVRSAVIEASVLNRTPWSKQVAFKTPVNTKEKAAFVLKGTLESINLRGPLEDLTLTLTEITGESGTQSSLFEDVRKQNQLKETMAQLEVRLRTRPPIYKVLEVEPWSRIPERRQALVEFNP